MRNSDPRVIKARARIACKTTKLPEHTHCVYGLYDKLGSCFYVGRTRHIIARSWQHFNNPDFANMAVSCRIFRWSTREDCGRLEFQIIRALQLKGQAQYNKHNGTARSEITRSRTTRIVLAMLAELRTAT